MNLHRYQTDAAEFGLVLRGGFYPKADDRVPDLPGGEKAKTLLLFGNAGSSIWGYFSASNEYKDGADNPLDRWSEGIGDELAQRWRGAALFPFGGPPFQPFIGWAKKAEGLRSSRLGMLLHPTYGLWHAYRFAMALPDHINGVETEPNDSQHHACDQCDDQSCLKTCPVDAFDGAHYDVKRCFGYLSQNPDSLCHRKGCQARAACPEGEAYRYDQDHAAFHMQKFYQSLQHRFKSTV